MLTRLQVLSWTAFSLLALGCGTGPIAPDSADADADALLDAGVDSGLSDASADVTNEDVPPDADAGADTEVSSDVHASADAGDVSEEPLMWADASECAVESCGLGECDPVWGTCRCDSGTFFTGLSCLRIQPGVPDECIVTTAALSPIASSETLVLTSSGPFQTAVVTDLEQREPDNWADIAEVQLARFEGTHVRVLAQPLDRRCVDYRFNRVFDVRAAYPAAAGEPGSDAVAADSDAIVGWATSIEAYVPGGGLIQEWTEAERALGPAEGNSFDIVSLGEGGALTLGFDAAISDGLGPDFVLFENSFSDTFLEFAFVEVSSNGDTFVRFDSASQTSDSVGQFGGTDPEQIGALGGRYRQGWGTPFDLGALRQRREVIVGDLDLSSIRYVRIVDVVGDGSMFDSFGRPIYDPTPTEESAGFDVDAVGVINVAGGE